MDRKVSLPASGGIAGRKLSTDVHRKLSAISNCSDISNLSFKLGMDPSDFKSTIQSILDLDRIDGWSTIDDGSDDDESLGCYAEESVKSSELLKQSTAASAAAQTIQTQQLPQTEAAAPSQMPPHVKRHQRNVSEVVTINVDRKASTGSQGSTGSSVGGDSLDGVDEGFVPVSIDVGAIRQVVARYNKHNRKISGTALGGKVNLASTVQVTQLGISKPT